MPLLSPPKWAFARLRGHILAFGEPLEVRKGPGEKLGPFLASTRNLCDFRPVKLVLP
jgi:hypothetical protein